jgi:hypothetical protein
MACDITQLSTKGESGGNPAAIGYDTGGGWSYGAVQIATKVGAMTDYLGYLQQKYPALYRVLINAGGNRAATVGTEIFKAAWVQLATTQRSVFLESQYGFIIEKNYTVAINRLKGAKIDLSRRGCAVQNAIYSLSVMAGPGSASANGRGSCGLIFDAIGNTQLVGFSDASILDEMYSCKIKRIDLLTEYEHVTPAIRASVRARMVREHQDALTMLANET